MSRINWRLEYRILKETTWHDKPQRYMMFAALAGVVIALFAGLDLRYLLIGAAGGFFGAGLSR